jgi:hypothetical protein
MHLPDRRKPGLQFPRAHGPWRQVMHGVRTRDVVEHPPTSRRMRLDRVSSATDSFIVAESMGSRGFAGSLFPWNGWL